MAAKHRRADPAQDGANSSPAQPRAYALSGTVCQELSQVSTLVADGQLTPDWARVLQDDVLVWASAGSELLRTGRRRARIAPDPPAADDPSPRPVRFTRDEVTAILQVLSDLAANRPTDPAAVIRTGSIEANRQAIRAARGLAEATKAMSALVARRQQPNDSPSPGEEHDDFADLMRMQERPRPWRTGLTSPQPAASASPAPASTASRGHGPKGQTR